MDKNQIIFVTGATGNQGGAVAKALSQAGLTVKALTRNPNSAKSLELKMFNAQLVKGDLDNPETFREDLKNVYGIFSVQALTKDTQKEINQGSNLAALAKEMGIRHFLYSSVAGAKLNTGISHMDSKFKIENHIRQLGLPFTIVRPAGLYQNFLVPQVKKGILKGKLMQPINRDTKMQYVACEDIGKAAVKIFQNTDKYSGRTIPLATEFLSGQEIADTFSKALNKKIKYQKLPGLLTMIFLGKNLYKMFKLMDKTNFFLKEDLDSTKKEFPEFQSLENWIKLNFIS